MTRDGDLMIEFKNVTKKYREMGVTAIDNVSFKIEKGEFVFLIGATGAGKTSAARLILREEIPDSGEIIIDKENIGRLRRRELPYLRRKIGVVFQDFKLLPYKTVFENIAFAMRAVNTPERNINHMIPQILSLVNLSDKADSYPSQLSGGEKQRAAMARAMANNPPILIADEPTGNLDPTASAEIMHLFERFNKLGTTVLVISHAREIIDKMQKRVLELNRGRLIRDSKSSGYYA